MTVEFTWTLYLHDRLSTLLDTNDMMFEHTCVDARVTEMSATQVGVWILAEAIVFASWLQCLGV